MSEQMKQTIPEYLDYYDRALPELSNDAAWERQLSNTLWGVDDQVASTLGEHNPRKPAIIADQFIEVETSEGCGKLPVVASRPLDTVHEDVTEVYEVTHGEIRNVW